MALFAETLVEEWLNRRGYFTVRGAKGGLLEMDLLAVRPRVGEGPQAVHFEVQASTRPNAWISKWTPRLQRELGVSSNNARKRSEEQLAECVEAWVAKKFLSPKVIEVREGLWPGLSWEHAFVHGVVKHREELPAIAAYGVEVIELASMIDELVERKGKVFKTTSSTAADIAALIGVDRDMR